MVVESVFTERSEGREVAGALVLQSANSGLFPCRVISKILENSIRNAALFDTQHLNNSGSFS